MNNIVNLSQLIAMLSKSTGTDINTSRRFLKVFFSTIEDALAHGESVTIKGFGTFRRSEDPTFGDPDGVAFIPDKEIMDEINRPFSMFEAVELADTITEAELEPIPTAIPELEDVDIPEPIVAPEPEAAPEPTPEPESEPISEPEPVAEPLPKPEPEPTPEPAPKQERKPRPEPVPIPEPLPKPAPAPEPEEKVTDIESEEETFAHDNDVRKNRTWLWISLGILVGAAIGVAAAFMDPSIPEIETLDDEEIIAVDTVANSALETIDIPSTSTETKVNTVSHEPQETTAEPVNPVQADPEPKEEPKTIQTKYDTVSSTRYLAVMAREYYGRSIYWVFIYEANADKLGDPNKVAPGTRVRIPDKSELPGKSPAETQKIAEQKAKEIQARY